jgi:hypothetical protein
MAVNKRNDHGIMLPAALFALILMSLVMIAATRLTDDERRSSRALRETGAALYVAESGLAATVGSWPAGANALNSGDSLSLGWTTLSNGGSYRPVIHRIDNGGNKTYALMIEGRGAGGLGGRSYLTRTVTTTSAPGAGFVTIGGFGLNTGNTADSYNSSGCGTPATDGCYTETRDSSVTILAGGAVDVHGAYVYGSIQSASTINTAGTALTGTATPNMSPSPVVAANYPTPACPASYSPASDLALDGVSTYVSGKLVIKSHITFDDTPSGGAYYFEMVTVSDQLDVAYSSPANPVTIYYHDKFVVSSGSFVNNLSKSPKNLKISSCLQAADLASYAGHGLTLSGGGAAYFQVYTPNQDVTVGGTGGGLWGSIVSKTIDATGGGNLHYDKALGGGTTLTLIAGSWAQTQP